MKTSEKLIQKLRILFPDFNEHIPLNEKPRRTYYGYYQKASGAWSWYIGGNINCKASYGSQWPMNELLRAEKLSLFNEPGGDISILPE